MAQENILREHLYSVIIDKVTLEADRRKEALADFFAVTGAVDGTRGDKVAELVPPILPTLYDKWINMFLDRLFETVPVQNIELIADGSDESNASAVLAYIMFLESERMEKQIAADLKAYGMDQTGSDDMGDLAAQYIRSSLSQAAKASNEAESEETKKAKAEAYRRKQQSKKAQQ